MSRHGSGPNGNSAGTRVGVVAPQRDRLFAEALARTLAAALPKVDRALRVDGFERAIQSCQQLQPSVVVTILGESTSMEAIRFADDLRLACPGASLVVIAYDDEDVVRAVEAGAMAVVPSSTGLDALADAICDVAEGKTHLDAEKLRRAMLVAARRRLTRTDVSRRIEELTEREEDVLRLVAQGASNKNIASSFHISIRTVDTHVTNILRKLHVHSKLEAAALLHRHGWPETESVRDSA
jgi:DNA-binding NarL/FixJ family response regulator